MSSAKKQARCPDCNSDVRSVPSGDGIYWVEVLHDDTCPWFAAQGAQSFRQVKVVRL